MKAVKILRPKAILGFTFAMLFSLTTSNLIFTLFYGFTTSLNSSLSGLSEHMMVVQEGSKSVHTGWVPLSLAKSLDKLPNVNAYAITLTPSTINGNPIVFRGVEKLEEYKNKIVTGRIPSKKGLWTLLGEKASKRLNLKLGDVVTVGSPTASRIMNLYVAGIYRFGDLKDYEAVVPYEVGVELAGLPIGVASAIQVAGISKEQLKPLLGKLYALTISYDVGKGQIVVLDALDAPIASFTIDKPGVKTLELPFGYYTLTYCESYLTVNVTSFILNRDLALTLKPPDTRTLKLKVITSKSESPILELENGTIVHGEWVNDAWIFNVSKGLCKIKLNEEGYPIYLIGNATFDPHVAGEDLTRIEVRVQWQDGVDVTDYLIFVKDMNGTILASRRSPSSPTTFTLPRGEYEVKVSKPPYNVKTWLAVPEQKIVTIILPVISNPYRVPPRMFQRLKAVTPVDTSASTLASLIGLTTTSLLALTVSLTALSILAVFTIQKALYVSAEDNLKILWLLGAGKKRTLRMLAPCTLALNLALSLIATYLTLIIHEYGFSNLNLTILGYGFQAYSNLTLAYSLLIAVATWLLSTLRLKFYDEEGL